MNLSSRLRPSTSASVSLIVGMAQLPNGRHLESLDPQQRFPFPRESSAGANTITIMFQRGEPVQLVRTRITRDFS